MKKIILLIVILLTCGCANYHELDNLEIISSIYIDYNNEYKITLEINDKEHTKYTESGNSIEETLRLLQINAHNHLYYNHLSIIAITKNVPIDEVIKYFIRNTQTNNTFYLIIEEGNFDEEKYGKKHKEILNDLNYKDFFYTTKKFYNNEAFVLPVFKDDKIINYEIVNNNKYVYTLSLNEYNLYELLTNKYNMPIHNDEIIVNVNKSKTKFNINDDIKITIDFECTIKELKVNLDTTKIKNITKLQNHLNTYVQDEINNFINTLKENKIDLLCINNKLSNKYHNYNHQFDEYNYKIEVISHINKKGYILR